MYLYGSIINVVKLLPTYTNVHVLLYTGCVLTRTRPSTLNESVCS